MGQFGGEGRVPCGPGGCTRPPPNQGRVAALPFGLHVWFSAAPAALGAVEKLPLTSNLPLIKPRRPAGPRGSCHPPWGQRDTPAMGTARRPAARGCLTPVRSPVSPRVPSSGGTATHGGWGCWHPVCVPAAVAGPLPSRCPPGRGCPAEALAGDAGGAGLVPGAAGDPADPALGQRDGLQQGEEPWDGPHITLAGGAGARSPRC